MILTSQESQASQVALSSHMSLIAPPPSYAPEDSAIHPLDKTPLVFSTSEENPLVLSNVNLSPSTSRSSGHATTSYYAIPSGSVTSPQLLQPNGGLLPIPFSRPPAQDLSYQPFKPIFLVAQSKLLDKGFPPAPPPSDVQPHPFLSHDVSEGDWISFLNSLQEAATLTERDIRRSRLPVVGFLPFLGYFSTMGVQQYMRHHRGSKVAKTIDMWNHHFFSLRKLRVILMKGKTKVSGLHDLPDGDKPVDACAPPDKILPTPDDDVYRLFVVPI